MKSRFWWVNQNQTYQYEIKGQYLWSPKHRSDGSRNPFYEFMKEVAPGDMIFSFIDTRIKAIGFAKSYAYECPKPVEFGGAGKNWNEIGWKIDVSYQELKNPIRPRDKIELLRSLLPSKYSPLQENGNGIQSVYLTTVSQDLADVLISLMDGQIQKALKENSALIIGDSLMEKKSDVIEWEDHIERQIKSQDDIQDTDRISLVNARRGQGLFKERVKLIERQCRITKVENSVHLIASHIKPWRDGENDERLDGENGLLLTPSIDHLFDRGFISFDNAGELLVSPRADTESLKKMGIPVEEKYVSGSFTDGQKYYLEYHRKEIFLKVS
jgi:putative restriction endonuclease